MFEQTKNPHRGRVVAVLVLSAISIGALVLRNQIVGNNDYNFLLWNLFLGFVPLLTAWVLVEFEKAWGSWLVWLFIAFWLLFYPNAPYMISDFIHVDKADDYLLYDALMIFNISLLSVFYGLYSLELVRRVIRRRHSSSLGNLVILASIILAAFGVYLGRVLRLNSWDVFTQPMKVISDIFGHLFPISANPETWALVIIFSFLQIFMLVLVQQNPDRRV